MSVHSHACCTVPPVVVDGYEKKGKHITVAGLDTYASGPSSAKKGILFVMDIFGFWPQTYQAVDILATGDHESNYQVFLPDWFYGKPADPAWYPPDTKEKGEKLGAFFQGIGSPPKAVSKIPEVISELKKSTGIETWGIVGLCWGGKVVNLSSQEGTLFKAAAVAHPAMVDPSEAPGVTIPYLMLPSKDEDADAVKKWSEAVKVKSYVETFSDQTHGWMGARGNIKDEKCLAEYKRGYKMVLDWFHEYL